MNDDIRNIPYAAHWGNCTRCKDRGWVSTQEDLCMPCKFGQKQEEKESQSKLQDKLRAKIASRKRG